METEETYKTKQENAPEEKEQAPKKKVQKSTQGEQYLYALFACADWITEEYRALAEAQAGKKEVLKELYMCACDGVDVKKAEEALTRRAKENALRALRRKKMEEEALAGQSKNAEEMLKKTGELEGQISDIREFLNRMAEQMNGLEAAFPKTDVPESGTGEETGDDVPKSGTQKEEEGSVPESGTQKETEDSVPESGTHTRRFHKRKKKSPGNTKKAADFIAYLQEEGYTGEQLDFLMDCLLEGMPVSSIKKIAASPALPVGILEKLKNMELRKIRKEGK